MSSNTDYPTEITLETLPQLLAAHRARFGGWTMTQDANTEPQPDAAGGGAAAGAGGDAPPARPEGVSEDEWKALGDPGQRAIVREREARQAAERQLAAARAKPAPPAKKAAAAAGDDGKTAKKAAAAAGGDDAPDIEDIISRAVAKAVQPFQEREEQRTATEAAEKIQKAVLTAATETFLDPTDALSGIDLTTVTDGAGGADTAKIKTELEDLLKRKPHLGKTADGRRYAAAGSAAGASQSTAPLDAKVKETLARMQASAGIKPPTT